MGLVLLSLLFLVPPAAFAAPAQPVASSTAPVQMTVADLYGGTRFRDPFRAPTSFGAGGGGAGEIPYNPEEFSIHSLNLKGILTDKGAAYAVLTDAQSGAGFVLKNGRLFDYRNKRVPGVTGVIRARQKTVVLMTPDKDVQILKLGETEEDAGRL